MIVLSMKEHSYSRRITELEAQLSRATSSAAHLKRAKEEVIWCTGIPQQLGNANSFNKPFLNDIITIWLFVGTLIFLLQWRLFILQ